MNYFIENLPLKLTPKAVFVRSAGGRRHSSFLITEITLP
jgi:hypothetical protein